MKNLLLSLVVLSTTFLTFSQNWVQQGSDIQGDAADDHFYNNAINSSGNSIVVGSKVDTGLGYIRAFTWNGVNWIQKGSTIVGEQLDDRFGQEVAMNSDGDVIAVSSTFFDSVNVSIGKVDVFSWNGSDWIPLGSALKGDTTFDLFGLKVKLNGAGDIMAVSSRYVDGFGVMLPTGKVTMYQWDGFNWNQMGSSIECTGVSDNLGASIDISKDGLTLALSVAGTLSSGPTNVVKVYDWSGSDWSQRGSDITEGYAVQMWGLSISLDSLGNRVAVGGPYSDGVTTSPPPPSTYNGVVQVYNWNGSSWNQLGQTLQGSETFSGFGSHVDLNNAGSRLVVSEPTTDGAGVDAGKIRTFEFSGSSWIEFSSGISGTLSDQMVGSSSFNADGTILTLGARHNGSLPNSGLVRVYAADNLGLKANNYHEIQAYPNPIESILYIELENHYSNADYDIIDLNGRHVLSGRLNEQRNALDLNNLKSGVYLIQMNNAKPIRIIKK